MTRIHIAAVLFPFVFLSKTISQPADLYRAGFSSDTLQKHIFVLGNDSLEGRGMGSRGEETAANYIALQLQSYGIQPVPSLGNYHQYFPVHGSKPLDASRLTVYSSNDTAVLRLQKDYVLYTVGAQTFIPSPVPLIFVGYGIVAPEYDYNDYQNVNVQNAVVVFLSGEPRSNDVSYFGGNQQTIYSSSALKQKTALARGARGSILIQNPNDRAQNTWEEELPQFEFEEDRLLYSPSENLNVLINPAVVDRLFRHSAYAFTQIIGFDSTASMKSFPLNITLTFDGKFFEREFLSSNVLGFIPGSDSVLKETYVLLSAHYDHLGIGPAVNGDSIYNGVYDNAAGVSSLLELARIFSKERLSLKRSIIVAFLTGEERGFIGSQNYCINPPLPLYKTIADVNIDGISMFEESKSFSGIGAELSSLGEILDSVAAMYHYSIEQPPDDYFRFNQFGKSDQFIFAQAGIPSILISEGLQYVSSSYEEGLERYIRWSSEIYHSPFDNLHQPMNFNAAIQHTEFLYHFIAGLANQSTAPEWNRGVPFSQARLRTIAEKK